MSAQFGQFPDVVERSPKKKRPKGRKLWAIECRIGKRFGWMVTGRYRTKEIRDRALEVLKRKAWTFEEYRIPPEEAGEDG